MRAWLWTFARNRSATGLDQKRLGRHFDPMLIYKILRADEWAALQTQGSTTGAPVDVADGFIHFSTAAQVRETAARHFAQAEGLMLLSYEAKDFGAALKWEPSRGGALFPHLFAALPLEGLIKAQPLPLGPEGHVFPEDLPQQDPEEAQ